MRADEPILATNIRVEEERLVIVLADREVNVPWKDCSTALSAATEQQRNQAELSPGGYGIHWPLLDEDLSVGGLVRRG